MDAWIAAIDLFQIDLVNYEIPYDTVVKSYLHPCCFLFERIEVAMPPLSVVPGSMLSSFLLLNMKRLVILK